MHPHFGFSFVTPARELLWKVSSGPRSEKVARLCANPMRILEGQRHGNSEIMINLRKSWLCFTMELLK